MKTIAKYIQCIIIIFICVTIFSCYLANGKKNNNKKIPQLYTEIKIVDEETLAKKPSYNHEVIKDIKEKVKQGKYVWLKDPYEVSKKYGNQFGFGPNAQYTLKRKGSEIGEYSGLFHSTVSVEDGNVNYSIALISEPDENKQPTIWLINAVTNLDEENKLRVTWCRTSPNSIAKNKEYIRKKYDDGLTIFFVDLKNPIVNFYVSKEIDLKTINSDTILVKYKNKILKGATFEFIKKIGSYGKARFPVYKIQVNLSGIKNIKNLSGENLLIILTDKIKDLEGNALKQCKRSRNKGECLKDEDGKYIKSYSLEVKLFLEED